MAVAGINDAGLVEIPAKAPPSVTGTAPLDPMHWFGAKFAVVAPGIIGKMEKIENRIRRRCALDCNIYGVGRERERAWPYIPFGKSCIADNFRRRGLRQRNIAGRRNA